MSVANNFNDHKRSKQKVKKSQGIIVLDDNDILEGITIEGDKRNWKPSKEDISKCFSRHPMLKYMSDNAREAEYICRHYVVTVTNMRTNAMLFKTFFQKTKVFGWDTEGKKKLNLQCCMGC